jgi:hypothetical protein
MMKSQQKRLAGWGHENGSREWERRQIGAADLRRFSLIKQKLYRKDRKGKAQRKTDKWD